MQLSSFYRLSIVAGLLLTLPQAMLGQTIRSYQSGGWWRLLLDGGIIRTRNEQGKRQGPYYLKAQPGLGSLLSMNYVDGYTIGPDLTLGYVDSRAGRWEMDVRAGYALSRETWVGAGALRYILPPQYHSSFEIFGGRATTDFDGEPMMDRQEQLMATGVFGWNGYKLYLQTAVGVKTSIAVSDDLQFDASLWYEQRDQMSNLRHRNLFGVRAQSNIPRLRGHAFRSVADDPSFGWEDDELQNWQTDHLVRLDASLSYTPHRAIAITDDLHSRTLSNYPVFTLKGQSGFDDADYSLRYLSLDLSVRQTIDRPGSSHAFGYMASVGSYLNHRRLLLQDMHHFNAASYCWQRIDALTWFSLLTNYELSTARRWMELHLDWSSSHLLFSRLVPDWGFREYVQLHALSVEEHVPHTEWSYGIQLLKEMRFGMTLGFDGSAYDGIAFNFTFNPVRRAKKK